MVNQWDKDTEFHWPTLTYKFYKIYALGFQSITVFIYILVRMHEIYKVTTAVPVSPFPWFLSTINTHTRI